MVLMVSRSVNFDMYLGKSTKIIIANDKNRSKIVIPNEKILPPKSRKQDFFL